MQSILNRKKTVYFILVLVCFLTVCNKVKADEITCYYKSYKTINADNGKANHHLEDTDSKALKMVYDSNRENIIPNYTFTGKLKDIVSHVQGYEPIKNANMKNRRCPELLYGEFSAYGENNSKYEVVIRYDAPSQNNYAADAIMSFSNTTSDTGKSTNQKYTTESDVANATNKGAESGTSIAGKIGDALGADVTVTKKEETTSTAKGCDKINGLGKYITAFYKILKYGVPTLIVVFSVFDFLGVVFSGEDDKMEKAKKNFMIRLIAGVLVLFIPTLLEFILSTAGIIDGNLADAACNFIK